MKKFVTFFEPKVAGSLHAWLIAAAIALALLPPSTQAQLQGPVQDIGVRPSLLKEVGIDQKLNQSIPLDLEFRDEHGKPVRLAEYFGQKPVILSMVYYNCPMLCTQVLNGLESSLKLIPMDIGKQFNVVTVSIDPTERPVLAEAKQALYTGLYGRPDAAQGWHFLTGDEQQIRQLANALGFRYAYDPDSKQFAHASAIMLLTPEGKISRYFYGIQFASRDLRLGLVEASEGKIGTPVDQVLLFCYHYDPSTGKYGLLISRLIQTAGAVTVLAIATLILVLYKKEHYALPERRT
ncbi:MAG TPA: SCO family protein [Candidatus Acidoferrales bacterium]|jgi:protein SCO1/2|nr:SCO family protein [Candidatus Acidoferrales bacterium]